MKRKRAWRAPVPPDGMIWHSSGAPVPMRDREVVSKRKMDAFDSLPPEVRREEWGKDYDHEPLEPAAEGT